MAATTTTRVATACVAAVVALGVVAVLSSSHHARGATTTRTGALQVVVGAGGVAAAKPVKGGPWAAADGVRALAPGQLRTVEVTVTNPGATAYRVLELTATPRDDGPDCRADRALVVSSYRSDRTGAPTYVVPRGSSIRIPVTVMRLALPGQDSCRDATFPLTLSGVVSPGGAATNSG